MKETTSLPIPAHFDPGKVGEVWRVLYQRREAQAKAWAAKHGIHAAAMDTFRICLLLVDCQNTFCIPGFELFVAGRSGISAVEDSVRLCQFIYTNLGVITEINATMDTHMAAQIFHSIFWVNERGDSPAPLTVISVADVEKGVWRVNPAIGHDIAERDHDQLQEYALHYVKELAARDKYELTIWPYHAMLGGIGHALVSAVEEAIFFHTIARNAGTGFQIKGNRVLTEHYSVLKPEVLTDHEGNPVGRRNARLIEELLQFDAVIIAGQAKSHCVAWTIGDLLDEISDKRMELAKKVYLLEDCTSPVVVPGVVDFTRQADAAFARFAEAGMHLVKSVDPIHTWPGMAG
jgi:nicotinamidase-related amidase